MKNEVILVCASWERRDDTYPGGVTKRPCAMCEHDLCSSNVNYDASCAKGPVTVLCHACAVIWGQVFPGKFRFMGWMRNGKVGQ